MNFRTADKPATVAITENGRWIADAVDQAAAERIIEGLTANVPAIKEASKALLREAEAEKRRAVLDAETKTSIEIISVLITDRKQARSLLFERGIAPGAKLYNRIKWDLAKAQRDFVEDAFKR